MSGRIIINSPYSEPSKHLFYEGEGHFSVKEGRRPSGFYVEHKDLKREFIDLPLVNEIRSQVKSWREAGWPGSRGTTRELLEHWHDRTARHEKPFFWCQIEAVETLVWLSETGEGREKAASITGDGGSFTRLCTKLCTGGGKTVVMAMLIAWQACSSVRNFLVVAPNLTVKDRLRVLDPSTPENYYDSFSVVPEGMRGVLRGLNVKIHNWHVLAYDTAEDLAKNRSVVKLPPKSDDAYCRDIIGGMKDVVVINDEAHHAWRAKPGDKKPKTLEEKENQREATVWVEGLDRIDRARNILACYDFTATPFVPGRGRNDAEGLFSWVVSDFSLDDGIEAGLVKTPCIVVRDDAPPDTKTQKSKLYHIYGDESVKADLTRSNDPEAPLPDLVRNAYELLGRDWEKTFTAYEEFGSPVPPAMITVANTTNTAARIEHAFREGVIGVPGLCMDILRIDSERLKKATLPEAERLRRMADTVGQEGQPGGQLRNIISVGMLSEGWDAHNVTHIMGLRAFTSQLLCEQIVGRGLRRTSYEAVGEGELFPPEYVNVFGIPFSYLLTEEIRDSVNISRKPTQEVRVLPERREFAITWPEVVGFRYEMRQQLSLDAEAIPELVLDASAMRISAELAPFIAGKENLDAVNDIDLESFYKHERMQRIIFRTAARVYDEMNADWQQGGTKLQLLGGIIRLTQEYLSGGRIKTLSVADEKRRKLVLCLNMEKIIRHMWQGIRSTNTEEVIALLSARRERSTEDMTAWRTSRTNYPTWKSHINVCVFDSAWESSAAYHLDKNPDVQAWAKNDHLGFSVKYALGGMTRKYLPDFLVRLRSGKMLVLEVKGLESEEDRAKHLALQEWVRGVNGLKVYGEWACDVSRSPEEVDVIIAKHA